MVELVEYVFEVIGVNKNFINQIMQQYKINQPDHIKTRNIIFGMILVFIIVHVGFHATYIKGVSYVREIQLAASYSRGINGQLGIVVTGTTHFDSQEKRSQHIVFWVN